MASYVGAKAYRHGEKHGDLMVRTFNAAPVDLQNASVEKNREQYPIYDYFINYRVQNDVVSSNIKHYADKGIRHGRYGSMVTLASDADPHHAHHLRTLKKIMPDVLLKQKIGDKLCLEQEKILGVFETLRYETLKCCQKARSRRSAKNQDDIEPLVQLFETCKASIDSALAVNDLDGAMVILIDFMDQLNVGEEQKESITNIVSDAYGYRPISIDERKMSVSVFSYCKKIIQDGLAALSSCVDYLVAKFSSNPSTNEENDDDDDDDLGSTRSRSFP